MEQTLHFSVFGCQQKFKEEKDHLCHSRAANYRTSNYNYKFPHGRINKGLLLQLLTSIQIKKKISIV